MVSLPKTFYLALVIGIHIVMLTENKITGNHWEMIQKVKVTESKNC